MITVRSWTYYIVLQVSSKHSVSATEKVLTSETENVYPKPSRLGDLSV